MVATTIPKDLMAGLMGDTIANVSTPEWEDGARKSVEDSFHQNFDDKAFFDEVDQTQIEHVVAHFKAVTAGQGAGQ